MSAKVVALLLTALLLLSLCACGTTPPEMADTQVQSQTETEAQQPQEGEQTVSEEQQQIVEQIIADSEEVMGEPPAADEYAWQTREGEQQDDGILVECSIYSLLLPMDWEGRYVIEETENWVSVYCKADMLEDYGGLLCIIGWTTEEMDYIGMPGYIMMGQATMDGVTYDVVADLMEVAEADASAQYLDMQKDVVEILGTLEFADHVDFVPAE